MPTPSDLIAEAAKYLGTTEDPPGSNHCVITEQFADMTGWEWARQGNPWCDMSVSVWLTAIGIPTQFAYCPTHVNAFRTAGAWLDGGSADCQPGDVVFFDWDHDGIADHVGIVEQTGTSIVTIEGNSGGPNGDGVWRQQRARSLILGYGRPTYSDTPPTPAAEDFLMALTDDEQKRILKASDDLAYAMSNTLGPSIGRTEAGVATLLARPGAYTALTDADLKAIEKGVADELANRLKS